MAGVQFFGSASVLQAFNARGIDTWGIFQGKDFICGGNGADSLTAFFKMLGTGSDAIYKLKVFKNIDDPDDITDKTECNGSFNFKLNSGAVGGVSGAGKTTGDVIVDKIRGIVEEEITEAIDRKLNGTGKSKNWDEIISGYIEDPDSLIGVINALKGLFAPKVAAAAPSMAIGALENRTPQSAEDQMRRIALAIDKLQAADPLILQHLEKLATLAEEDPDIFAVLIKKIDKL